MTNPGITIGDKRLRSDTRIRKKVIHVQMKRCVRQAVSSKFNGDKREKM